MQSKKLKTEERLQTLQLLASLAPSSRTSAALASTSTLGQNPLRPSSVRERIDRREDKLVRRGIERSSKRLEDPRSGSESEDGSGSSKTLSKGREKAVERAEEAQQDHGRITVQPVNGDNERPRPHTRVLSAKKVRANDSGCFMNSVTA